MDEFRMERPGAPCRQIRGVRNIAAHSYGAVAPEITWEILTEAIPKLKAHCGQIIAESKSCPIRCKDMWIGTEHKICACGCQREFRKMPSYNDF